MVEICWIDSSLVEHVHEQSDSGYEFYRTANSLVGPEKRDTVPIVSNTKLPSSVTLISLKGVRRQSNLRVSEAITDYVASFELQEIIIPPRYKMMVVVDKEQYDWLPSQSLGVTLMKGALNL